MSDRKVVRSNAKGLPCRFHHAMSPDFLNDNNMYVPNPALNFNIPESPEGLNDHLVPSYSDYDEHSIGSQEDFSSSSDVKSPLYSRSFINLLNDSDVIPDVDPEDEMAYYEMMNEQLPVADIGQRNYMFHIDPSFLDLEDLIIPRETSRNPAQMEDQEITQSETDDDFFYLSVTPETFRRHFQHKQSCYPDETAEKPKILELGEIMDLIISTASPQCTEGVSLLEPLSSIANRFRAENVQEITTPQPEEDHQVPDHLMDVSFRSRSIDDLHATHEIDAGEELSQDVFRLQPAEEQELMNELSRNAVPALNAITPTSAFVFTYGNSYETNHNIDEFQEDDDEVFLEDGPISDDLNETAFHTPPHTMREDEEFYSFLSSRSRKIARNMSVGRKDKKRDHDHVQPKKLFLD